jgi:hypothetical protein
VGISDGVRSNELLFDFCSFFNFSLREYWLVSVCLVLVFHRSSVSFTRPLPSHVRFVYTSSLLFYFPISWVELDRIPFQHSERFVCLDAGQIHDTQVVARIKGSIDPQILASDQSIIHSRRPRTRSNPKSKKEQVWEEKEQTCNGICSPFASRSRKRSHG